MRWLRVLLVSVTLTVFVSGIGHAEYLSDYDQEVSLTLAPELLTTSGSTGETSFELQEQVHETVTDTSGKSVDHYYVWVYVNGEPVLAADPAFVEAD